MGREWQKDLSFSERVAATSKMHVAAPADSRTNLSYSSAAYRIVNPECTPAEATKYAKVAEEKARKAAISLEAYHERCDAEKVALCGPSTTQKTLGVEDLTGEATVETPEGGAVIGPYANAQHFKDGLFSEVFKAVVADADKENNPNKVVALKVTTPSVMHPPHDSEREARILRAAKSDNIIPLLETFKQPGGRFVLAFPYMTYDLDTLLHRRSLPVDSRRRILRDLATGLEYIHSLGIIHRDIKPSNILMSSPHGPAYIADFGIAWAPSDVGSEPADAKILDVGTTCYRPPQLLFGCTTYDTTLDLWATGCVAAQIVSLNGATLFDAGDLGSELALIKSIFETMGTPNLSTWPEAATLPDWGKMNFQSYPGKKWSQILPDTEPSAIDLVSHLIVYESSERLAAGKMLSHPYLDNVPP